MVAVNNQEHPIQNQGFIRTITVTDAEAFLDLCRQLDVETNYMMLEPGERRLTVEQQAQRIQEWIADRKRAVFVCEAVDELVGYIDLEAGTYKRNQHSVYLVIGVRQDFSGRGLGTRLMQAGEQWARTNNLHRLELTVMTHNVTALALYRKMGFEIEGTRRDSLRVGETYVDEYALAKILE